ncbi:hypothetical protein ACP4OV_022475 [Aristida adscensionis]
MAAAAASWVRSLSCNSSAVADDVYRPPPPPTTTRKRLPASCAATDDVKLQPRARRPRRRSNKPTRPPQLKPPPPLDASPAFLAMTELPDGHYSRRVVELIFAAGWTAPPAAEVEALFPLHSAPRAVASFEAARAAARARGAQAKPPRCAADGNEMMRFQCRAAEADGGVICAAVATCSFGGGPANKSSAAVRTFAGSGAAHAGAGHGAGRRAMLVCRVIAGRVRAAASDDATGYDSVDMGSGELVVLDSRAVLPCFLVIYRVKDRCCTTEKKR